MAKILNADKHGSVGPSTFQSSRHGTIERVRVHPVQPNTAAQQNQRSLLSAVSSQWRDLTDEQRDAWRALAAQRAGQLSGSQTYNQINAVLVKCGLPTLALPPAVPVFGRLSCAGLLVEQTPRLVLQQVGVAGGADRFLVEACAPMSQGISYIGNRFRFLMAAAVPAQGATELDLTAVYIERFGEPEAGERVFVRICAMQEGFKSMPLLLSAIATAGGS